MNCEKCNVLRVALSSFACRNHGPRRMGCRKDQSWRSAKRAMVSLWSTRNMVQNSPPVSFHCILAPFLGREIIGTYLLGFDIIRVVGKDRIGFDVQDIVKNTVSRLVGLEIVEEKLLDHSVAVFVGAFRFSTRENPSPWICHCCWHASGRHYRVCGGRCFVG